MLEGDGESLVRRVEAVVRLGREAEQLLHEQDSGSGSDDGWEDEILAEALPSLPPALTSSSSHSALALGPAPANPAPPLPVRRPSSPHAAAAAVVTRAE